MAYGEDSLSNSSEITDKGTHVRCCENRLCNFKVCVNYFSLCHKNCSKRHTNLKILSESKQICCERSDNNEKQEEHEETKYDGKQMLLMGIRYLELLKGSKVIIG
ncbi:hypothetical protein WA026_012760 [Henosepilachna vigintioctopunctata]|uniref:Uncharacterized protein n=1 Tax=Henosepilachna vigintioctopunctata TaxID=420089 RepID=A0AAW1TXY1_9CUCU